MCALRVPQSRTMGLRFYGRRALVTDIQENKMIIKFWRVAASKIYNRLQQIFGGQQIFEEEKNP